MNEDKDCEKSREKYWNELTDSEKIERTRSEVKDLMRGMRRTERAINKIKRDFRKHSHGNAGELLKRIEEYERDDCEIERDYLRKNDRDGDEIYF